jgi:hypothetical protein
MHNDNKSNAFILIDAATNTTAGVVWLIEIPTAPEGEGRNCR